MKTVTRETQIQTINLLPHQKISKQVEANDAGQIPRARKALRARKVAMRSPTGDVGRGLTQASRMIGRESPRKREENTTAQMIPKEAEENSRRRMMTPGLLPVAVTEIKALEEAKEKEKVRRHPPLAPLSL